MKTRLVLLGLLLAFLCGLFLAQRGYTPSALIGMSQGESQLITARSLAALPAEYARPPSAWKARERAFYERLLGAGPFDVLIVPFQAQQDSPDRATRSYITAHLTLAVAQSGKRVPDPYLVGRAFGDGERAIAPAEAYRIAEVLQVKRIIWPLASYTSWPTASTHFVVQYQDRNWRGVFSGASDVETKDFEAPTSDEDPPTDAFARLVPDILQFIGVEAAPAPPAAAAVSTASAPLPETPLSLLAAPGSPADDAYVLQLFATLAPLGADRTRERFSEKSLLAASLLPRDSKDYRLLRARALMQLGFRAAARSSIDPPQSAEEEHLRAFLDGNLAAAEAAAAKVAAPLPRLIAALETNAIAVYFGVREQAGVAEAVKAWALPGEIWPFLAGRAAGDLDAWAQFDNLALKVVLDREFPIADFTAEGIVRGGASLGDPARIRERADFSAREHVARLTEQKLSAPCCVAFDARPTALDYLELLDAMATDNLVRRANFYTQTQGSPERAMDLLSRYETVYKEHPQFVMARAKAERKMAERSDGAAKENYLRSAYQNAFNAYYWEQGQTPTAGEAADFFWGAEGRRYAPFTELYSGDRPIRPHYPVWHGESDVEARVPLMLAALRNATYDFDPAVRLFTLNDYLPGRVDMDEVLALLDRRFLGHPRRSRLTAELAAKKGHWAEAEQGYRETVRADPTNWNARMALGSMLFEGGRIEEAAQVFLEHPGFAPDSDEHRVAVANHAQEAGSIFYWSGHFAQARPLYRISSSLNTGADSGLASGVRLQLMDGDLPGALVGLLERARRYNSSYAYRDYLGLLHAMGGSADAWQGFDLLAVQLPQPHIWESALVGHRLAGLGEADIATWAARDAFRSTGEVNSFPAIYLMRAAHTDRLPSPELPSRLEAIERPVWKIAEGDMAVVRPSRDGSTAYFLGPNVPGPERWQPLAELGSARKPIASDFVRFTRAYRLVKTGAYAEASAQFAEATTFFDLTHLNIRYALSYYAYAAARAGNPERVEAVLSRMPVAEQRFDYFLAKGVIAAIRGDSKEALALLGGALRRRPYTDNRPLYVEHQFAEMCEWLFEATRDAKYRDLAISWAKQNQISQPWYAWPYAMEAKLAANSRERRRAIAMAHHLDKDSERLSKIPRAQIDAAVKEFAGRLPFPAAKGRDAHDST